MAFGSISFRNLWTRALLKRVHYRNRHQQLDNLYRVEDPWNLNSARERFRFERTNQLIEREFGRVTNLLEIGCGEGHQSQYLAQICDRLHGYDVSARAIERASKRCPTGIFSVGALSDITEVAPSYDLVVACEVLYYMKDVSTALETMCHLGASCLVTYYESQQKHLDQIILPLQLEGRTVISNDNDAWVAVWWRNKKSSNQTTSNNVRR